jgi:hypothetical protein
MSQPREDHGGVEELDVADVAEEVEATGSRTSLVTDVA